jgi:hypothetical protein
MHQRTVPIVPRMLDDRVIFEVDIVVSYGRYGYQVERNIEDIVR